MTTRSKFRALVLGIVSALVLVPTATLAAASAKSRPHHTKHHVTRVHHASPRPSGIPQHNGGDHDSDNNGGPSDGDGNQ